MMNIRRTVRKGLHQLGLELTRAPVPNWTRYRWAILPVLDRFHINCVLDVGANAGQFGHSLRELDYDGWIISFEPVSGPRVRLEQAAKADPKWRVCPYALGSIEGEA